MREPFIAAYIDKGVWWSTYKCALWAILACGWPIRASDLLAGPPVTNDWKKTHLFFFSYLLLCFCGRPPIPKSMFIFGFPLMHCNDSPPLFARLHQGFDSFARDLWVIMFDGPDEIFTISDVPIVTTDRQKRGNHIKTHISPYAAFTTKKDRPQALCFIFGGFTVLIISFVCYGQQKHIFDELPNLTDNGRMMASIWWWTGRPWDFSQQLSTIPSHKEILFEMPSPTRSENFGNVITIID